MAKRKLSTQQLRRIRKIQQARTARAKQRDEEADNQLTEGELGHEQSGLVISHYGKTLDVEALESPHRGQLFRCHQRANITSLVTGDRVVWRSVKGQTGVVVSRLERTSELLRPDNFGHLKPVAANVDFIVIVIAPRPMPFPNLIDRYLVACEATGITPVLLINKSDLIDQEPNQDNDNQFDTLERDYQALGYRVLRTSIKRERSLKALHNLLRGRTSVLVGQSGVGKSSLINVLLPGTDLRVGDLSAGIHKGTHTTTTARLVHLPGGGNLIDSPGIREFGLWHLEEDELQWSFIEFRAHLGACRFRNCRHVDEPGCAVLAAVTRGEISQSRMHSYHHILQSLADPPGGRPPTDAG